VAWVVLKGVGDNRLWSKGGSDIVVLKGVGDNRLWSKGGSDNRLHK
jgi:hypothetical protein